MQAGDVELGQVFIDNHQFRIPMFQRPYVWDATKNWQPLWDDLSSAADTVLAEVGAGEFVEEPATYFLGAVVVKPAPQHPQRLSASWLVDGQQRLTTLQIMLAAARAVAHRAGVSSVVGRLSSWIDNKEDAIHDNYADDRFKLWPLPQDRDEYLWAVRAPEDGRAAPAGNHRLVRARGWFEDQIGRWASDDVEVADQRLNALFVALSKRMKLVRIVLDKTDDMQIIFEALNHRGVELSQSDLVKNLLFWLVHEQGDQSRAEKLLTDHWLELDKPRWRADVVTGRITRSRLDVVIGYWLAIQKEEVIAVENLFDEFKALILDHRLSASDTIRAIRAIADTYDWLLGSGPDDATRELVDHIVVTKTNTVWPLLLATHMRDDITKTQKSSIARAINSFLMRRRVCGGTTKDYNRYFISLLPALRNGARSAQDVEIALARSASETREWPTDVKFVQALFGNNLYALSSAQLRVFFAGLENFLRDERAEDQTRVLASNSSLNIEHVMPQGWDTNWDPIVPDDANEDEKDVARSRRANAINALGNLTLTNGRLNSAMQDAHWTEKQDHLRAKSTFLITTASILSKPEGAKWDRGRAWADDWTEDNINHRTMYLIRLALKVWARPDIEPISDAELNEPDEDEDNAIEDD